MNEVEKMYENAGIEKSCNSDLEFCPVAFCDECNLNIYPPFTAEKQLELIKWLAKKYSEVHIKNNMARGFAIGIMGISFNLKRFEEIIAMVMNTFWQDLTDADKAEIKNILEM